MAEQTVPESSCAVQPRRRTKIVKPGNPSIVTAASLMTGMSRVELGALAEDFVYYQLRRRGIDVYRPAYSKEAVDFVVLVRNKIWRCQVKACAVTPMEVRLRHTVYKGGQYSLKHFERGKVDIFFIVDLIHENTFVIPDDAVGNRRSFKMTSNCWAWQFKDKYEIFLDE